jgi:stage II sporulation protein D
MKHIVAAALSAVLILFLIPLLAFGGAQAGAAPSPMATLPPDPGPAATAPAAAQRDAQRTVHVLLEGDQVVELTMADYLKGVVAAEMPASFEYEALKAPAVAARTYAYYRLGHPSANNRRPSCAPTAAAARPISIRRPPP